MAYGCLKKDGNQARFEIGYPQVGDAGYPQVRSKVPTKLILSRTYLFGGCGHSFYVISQEGRKIIKVYLSEFLLNEKFLT